MRNCRHWFVAAACSVLLPVVCAASDPTTKLTGVVTDAATGKRLPARLYLQSADGRWFWARSAVKYGSAVEYRKQRSPTSIENHTTLSADPFVADLPPGEYTLTVERGKEYFTATRTVTVGQQPVDVKIPLRRWINMAERGWYSGDTHVHRTLEELPNVVQAEDLNVALPLTNWVTTAYAPPGRGNKNASAKLDAQLIKVDATHVIYPVNTEYEIFSVGPKRHTLGAVFVLNHKTQLKPGAPPVGPVAKAARSQGALLDLDKHSWPWSMMLLPIMDVDLFELSNNHIWRTGFHYRSWTIGTKPQFVDVEIDGRGFTEWGWMNFGFANYYALLNCGFRMRPTAGTASGVHPVPLGFGRVYVQLKDGFNYDAWMKGLDAGRSFVSTGPMLFVQFNNQPPGHTFRKVDSKQHTCHVTGSAESSTPLSRIEVIVNGQIQTAIKPQIAKTDAGSFTTPIDVKVELDGSSWVAVRCFTQLPENRIRFAHTAPVHFDVPGHPLRPRRIEVEYFIQRMQEELARNKHVLKPDALDEYRQALRVYQKIAETAR